jgi:chromosome segregation ATPase
MTKKKVSKKSQVSVKVEAEQVKKEVQRLTPEEMRTIEELTHAINSSRSRKENKEQLITNIKLKQENLQNQIQMLNYDIRSVASEVQKENEVMESKLSKLKILGDELKSKYSISSDELKYNPRTGELI